MSHETRVAILDAGAQYGKVIDRRVRELNVECEILPLSTPVADLAAYHCIIVSGGPQSVYEADSPKCDPELFNIGKPIFGICYGLQLVNKYHSGTVHKKDIREDGQFDVNMDTSSLLFKGLDPVEKVLLTHGDSIDKVAEGFRPVCMSGKIVAAIENAAKKIYAVQFHPEVDLTENGKKMFANFLFEISGCNPSYTLKCRQTAAIDYIKGAVHDKKVLVLASGGVDSTVCCALLSKAIGNDRLIALHVDHGFMRHNESAEVHEALTASGVDLAVANVQELFANATTVVDGVTTKALKDTVVPEVKRKIIGDTFMTVVENYALTHGIQPGDVYLAQGTLRPDLIESASHTVSAHAAVIKTHHNDSHLVRVLRAKGRVIEPLQDYHKDEVRELGCQLGLPEHLVYRQPFPGPGLAIRVICTDGPYLTSTFDEVNIKLAACVDEGVYATLLPVRTVGVQGDGRSYHHIVAISCDGAPKWEAMCHLAKVLPRQFHDINRAIFVMGKPVKGPIRTVTPTTLHPDTVAMLQKADAIVNDVLSRYNLLRILSQVPVVLFPVAFEAAPCTHSIGIRAFITNDFMTGRPAVPGTDDLPLAAVEEMVARILKDVPTIGRVALDLTPKPPATTEWE